ncbi:hypothetical protein NTE_00502 [Candidatus Nitrososphaera evergladensis SR1]|uniref:Gp5/Type VI secretion system Vgr protein OB-fold domain-containing protein n=1 Tax=Candidatus Nitrososphaera evergladensis SR1 TaxID=1459636 RepID=A0A075MMT0_9ARCH|nr:phage baseplate assembly protein V [Candidatus Nitrososphaera evergladensis]AIF82583.1 hypothetical protein NTE_00502 [Candidatus Nitrososphaera evergladensis SR1]
MIEGRKRVYGKFRGKVADNADPKLKGRIRVKLTTSIYGDEMSGWAEPSLPYCAPDAGFFFVPPVDANVWVEFEEGDPDKPIWTGCFWNPDESPVNGLASAQEAHKIKMIKTESGTIKIDDREGQDIITIETASGLKIVMNSEWIELSNNAAKIKMTSSSVSVNDGALEVT